MEDLEVDRIKREPVWESSVEDLEVDRIKREPVWESSVEDLYADHKVKHELVLGPEMLQQVQMPVPHTIEVTVKIENGETCEEIENERTHEEELLKCCKKPDIGVIIPLSTNNDILSIEKYTDKHYYLSQKDLFSLQNCFVRIERMSFHKEKHTCKNCGKSYSQRLSLTHHILRIHAKKKATAKKEISNSTTKNTTKETRNHVNIKKNAVEKPHKCGVCGKQFKLKALLTNHERTHTGEKPYSCTICNRRFTELSNLRRHERTHTGEKPFSCEICKKQFSFKCNLMDHIRIHTKERPYSCNLCCKQFLDQSGLKRHKLSHTGYKKFICDICKNQFARKYYLIDHLRTHTKKKPYSCEICSKEFEKKCNLRAHKKHHEICYLCEICDEQFSKILALKRHLLTHLG